MNLCHLPTVQTVLMIQCPQHCKYPSDDEILHNNYKSQSLIKNLLPSKYEYKFTESSTVNLDSFNCTFKIKLATEQENL